jgi:DNA-binding NarL/FixJ family response regulator
MAVDSAEKLPPLPISSERWHELVRALHLPPQQAKVVELILRGQEDKQIANQMRLAVPTVRTYLSRIFVRLGVTGRMELVLHLFARSHRSSHHDECHHK